MNHSGFYENSHVVDLLMPWLDYGSMEKRLGVLDRLRGAGYTYISLTVSLDGAATEEVMHALARERAYFLSHPDRFVLVERVDDIRRAKRESKLGIGFHFQGTDPYCRDVDFVDLYAVLGVRQALMAYNQKNFVGDGCHELTDAGLSRFGVSLVERMNEVGVLVDVSHTGYRTATDVLDVSGRPVIFSHSNPRALFDHGRNIPDDLAIKCAQTGGVVGINGCGMFMVDNDVTPQGLFRMIDYYVDLIGAPHVGIGLDYLYDLPAWLDIVQEPQNASRYPTDGDYRRMDVRFADPEELPALAELMIGRGYSETDVRGILGENWLRVMNEVWS